MDLREICAAFEIPEALWPEVEAEIARNRARWDSEISEPSEQPAS